MTPRSAYLIAATYRVWCSVCDDWVRVVPMEARRARLLAAQHNERHQ